MDKNYVIGLDFGSDSVRALVVDTISGCEEASSVYYYPRWEKGRYCETNKKQFRQHPLDYLESMEKAVNNAIREIPGDVKKQVIGIGVDTTGSTLCAVNKEGIPLALLDKFRDNPNAMFLLWKDHTAIKEAEEINNLAKNWGGIDYTRYEGGVYSSEWFWAKILHILRKDESVRKNAFSWVEHCDWITAVLTGNTDPLLMKRSRCAAGHKAMWHDDWQGLPSEEFLIQIDPLLSGLRERLFIKTYTSDFSAGGLCREWADRLGLKEGIAVAVGAIDAHMGAVGGCIKDKTLVKIMGTSSCDIMVAPKKVVNKKIVPGICGQVDGSVIPGMIGFEAGQSAYGDVYAWFKKLISWPLDNILLEMDDIDYKERKIIADKIADKILPELNKEAKKITIEETGLIALDWLNGRRSPYADQSLKGAVVGLTLASTAPRIFRALVEATAFGSRAIIEQFTNEGVEIEEVIALGGIAKKSDFVMQVNADVMNKPIKVVKSEQACALGAAMFAAVAAGVYDNITDAQEIMGSGFSKIYYPDRENLAKYDELYKLYSCIGDKISDELGLL